MIVTKYWCLMDVKFRTRQYPHVEPDQRWMRGSEGNLMHDHCLMIQWNKWIVFLQKRYVIYRWKQVVNLIAPGSYATQLAKFPDRRPKPAIFQHAIIAILHLCVAITICSSYHVMIPFKDSIKMPHDIRYMQHRPEKK